MKREVMPASASPWRVTPSVGIGQVTRIRAPRAHLATALVLLQPRELTVVELASALHRRFPNDTVHSTDVVYRLRASGLVDQDKDGKLGLTEAGVTEAERMHRESVPAVAERPILDDAERRAALLLEGQAPRLLTKSPPRQMGESADLATPPLRDGAEQHLRPPSRIGDHLHYRDGRVTTLDGVEVQPARAGADYYPTHNGSARARQVFPID